MTPPETAWTIPPPGLVLDPAQVHVWRISLARLVPQFAELASSLPEDERARAARFRFPVHRNRFIAAHRALRAILAHYLRTTAAALRFQYSGHGKPSLASGVSGLDLHFNLSHSNELALVGVTLGRDIGVDIEQVRPEFAGLDIAQRFFAPGEVAALRALPEPERASAFFRCWTRKEAFVKARGEGLSLPLDRFEVSLQPGVPAALLRAELERDEASRWEIADVAPGAGYAGAVAVRDRGWTLRTWEFPAETGVLLANRLTLERE